MKKARLKDVIGGQEYTVHVKSSQKGAEITGTKEVLFGKIEGKGKEYAFRIPTRFKRV